MRHNPGHGIMGQLVQRGAIVINLLEESGLRRHLHIVVGRHIEGAIAADAEIHARCGNDVLGDGHDLPFGKRRGIGGKAGAQAFALGDVENGKAFEEGNGLGVLACLAGALLLLLGGEAVGIDNGGPALGLPDTAARFKRLPECQPRLRGIVRVDHRAPQYEHVDAAVIAGGERIARQARIDAGSVSVGAAPRLNPWQAAFLKLLDDFRRHFGVDVARRGIAPHAARGRFLRHGEGSFSMLGLSGERRGAPPQVSQASSSSRLKERSKSRLWSSPLSGMATSCAPLAFRCGSLRTTFQTSGFCRERNRRMGTKPDTLLSR